MSLFYVIEMDFFRFFFSKFISGLSRGEGWAHFILM